MSFHSSSEDIYITQEDGSTMLHAKVRNNNGEYIQRKIRLDDHIGNTDGWFLWGGHDFTQSASNIDLEQTPYGPKLCADLRMGNGGSRGRQGVLLSEKIGNQDGHLKFTGA